MYVSILMEIQNLYQHRSPFYNTLRTHFGLYGFPLELDIFQTEPIGEIKNGPHHDKLPLIFGDKSPNATPDSKQQRVRFSRIQKTGNWVTIDFGTPCLLTNFEILWRTDNNNSSSIVQVDCWLEESQMYRIINQVGRAVTITQLEQKVEPSKAKKTDEKINVSVTQLSIICRYIRINAKPFNPSSYEGATLVINAYGIVDYISPYFPQDQLIPKLKFQIQSTEERQVCERFQWLISL